MHIGAAASGLDALNPGQLLGSGITVVERLRQAMTAKFGLSELISSISLILPFALCYIMILVAYVVLAGQLMLVQIRAIVWIAMTPLLLGFSGSKSFRDIAVHSAKGGISLGALIIAIYFVAAIANGATPLWSEGIRSFEVADMNDLTTIWTMIALAFWILMAAWTVPKIAADLVNGTISGGLEETMATAAAAMAAAATVATSATNLAKTAGGAASDGLDMLRKAVGAGGLPLSGMGSPSDFSGTAKPADLSVFGSASSPMNASPASISSDGAASNKSSAADKFKDKIPPHGSGVVGVNANIGGAEGDD